MFGNIRSAVVGSINMDIILSADRLPEVGENVLGSAYSYAFGGKGANQATALARLGAKVKMIGKVAEDANGQSLLANLKNNNINVAGVAVNGSQTGLAAILLDGQGRNRIIVYEGANAEIVPAEAEQHIDDSLDLLLVQFETAEEVVTRCVNRAVQKNIMTVVDCGPAKPFCLEKMQGITILSPNESETKALTGIFPDDEEKILTASRILKERSLAQFVVLKLGEKGCSVFDGDNLTLLPPYPTNVTDTTAAGDCFTAAMALEFAKNGDILKACDLGNKAGAFAVSKLGAQNSMPTLEELLNM
ncbi:MAG: ribokinase [Clostridia bacterium]|nr:ribokinase [Clostridia bacterium]